MTDDNLWELDFDGWTLGEDAMYISLLNRVRDTGDLRPLFAHWARMIKHWPFAKNPGLPSSYVGLDEAMYNEIIERVNRGIRSPKRADGRSGGGET
jgi:hypothetical protein